MHWDITTLIPLSAFRPQTGAYTHEWLRLPAPYSGESSVDTFSCSNSLATLAKRLPSGQGICSCTPATP